MPNQKAMYRNLESMHRAGIGWIEALEAAAPGKMASAKAAVRAGRPLSEALQDEVDALDMALIRAGESSGALEATFARLATRHEKESRRRKETRAAVLYPVVLAHVGAVLLAIPELISGRTMMAVAWASAMLLPCWGWMFLAARSQRGTRSRDPVPPRLVHPLNQSAIEDADARALLALGDLLDAAVPLGETLRLSARAGAGGRIAPDLAFASIGVESGKPISTHFQHTPDEVARALTVAESTGDLSQTARDQADQLEFNARIRREKFRAILPIFMMLTIGGLVAYRVISFYMKAFTMPF